MRKTCLLALIWLTGCFGVTDIKQEGTQAKYLVESPDLNRADMQQLLSSLSARGLTLFDGKELDGYRVHIRSIEHDTHELVDKAFAHAFYNKIYSSMSVDLYDRQRGELIWHRTFHEEIGFRPNVSFHADLQWAQAQLLYEQQSKLFQQLALALKGPLF